MTAPDEGRAASAHERADALAPHLDRARQHVAELEGAVRDAEQQAHGHYVRADVAAADSAHAAAAAARAQLEAARAKLATFEEAGRAVALERQREALEARLAALRDDLARELAGMRDSAAQVWPAITAARSALRSAEAAELRAGVLAAQVRRAEAALAGEASLMPVRRPGIHEVRLMVEASRLLTDLARSPEL